MMKQHTVTATDNTIDLADLSRITGGTTVPPRPFPFPGDPFPSPRPFPIPGPRPFPSPLPGPRNPFDPIMQGASAGAAAGGK